MVTCQRIESLKNLIKILELSGTIIIEDGKRKCTLFSYFLENEVVLNKRNLKWLIDNRIFSLKQVEKWTKPIYEVF